MAEPVNNPEFGFKSGVHYIETDGQNALQGIASPSGSHSSFPTSAPIVAIAAVAHQAARIVLHSNTRYKKVNRLPGHSTSVSSIAALPENGCFVTASDRGTLRFWDENGSSSGSGKWSVFGKSSAAVWSSSKQVKYGRVVATLSDGRVVNTSSEERDFSVKVYHRYTKSVLSVMSGHSAEVSCLAVMSGDDVVSGSHDKTVRVWNPATGACLRVFTGHTDAVWSLAVLSQNRIASGGNDKSIRIWNIQLNCCDSVLEGHTSNVRCLSVLPSGLLASGSYDKSIRLWNSGKRQSRQNGMHLDGSQSRRMYGHTTSR
eukprot:gene29952-37091_t